MKKIVLIVVAFLIIFAGYAIYEEIKKEKTESNSATPTSSIITSNSNVLLSSNREAKIENFSFNPPVLEIKAGDTVVWTNKDSAPHQIASDPHPKHTDLPALSSGNLSINQTYSFTFNDIGEFNYHCHLHPYMKGKIIVK